MTREEIHKFAQARWLEGNWRDDANADPGGMSKPQLDAIDRAYVAHEFPLRIVRTRAVAPHERGALLARLAAMSRSSVLVLPPDTYVETFAPQAPHPFDLARWADDGGRV